MKEFFEEIKKNVTIIEKNNKEIKDFNELIESFKINEEKLLEEIKDHEENEQKFMGQVKKIKRIMEYMTIFLLLE